MESPELSVNKSLLSKEKHHRNSNRSDSELDSPMTNLNKVRRPKGSYFDFTPKQMTADGIKEQQ